MAIVAADNGSESAGTESGFVVCNAVAAKDVEIDELMTGPGGLDVVVVPTPDAVVDTGVIRLFTAAELGLVSGLYEGSPGVVVGLDFAAAEPAWIFGSSASVERPRLVASVVVAAVGEAAVDEAAVGDAAIGGAPVGITSADEALVGEALLSGASVGRATVGEAIVAEAIVGGATVGEGSVGEG